MKLMVRVLAGFAFILLMTACGSLGVAQSPTQTPQYVVITDTPDAVAAAPVDGTLASDVTANTPAPSTQVSETGIVPIPTPFLCKGTVIEQSFENGFMFWVGATAEERCKIEHSYALGTGEIWVSIFPEDGQVGEWVIIPDTFDEQVDPESDPNLEPPSEGLAQPVRGFGKAWREGLTQDQRDRLGWATGTELPFVTDYRYDAGGFLNDAGEYVPRPGTHRIMALGGEQFFYDEQTSTTFYIAATE